MMRKLKNREVIAELKRMADRHGGLLTPEVVVRSAESERSPLHNYFTWEDDAAARSWRLHQARQLLSVCVEYIGGENSGHETRVFVSLKSDRVEGGYRPLVSVLEDVTLRDQLLLDAMESMAFFREKYRQLKELGIVFRAIEVTQQRVLKSKRKKK
jgi:hypothetical protein